MTATREALDADVSYYDHVAHLLCSLTLCRHFPEDFLEPSYLAFWHIPGFLGLFNIAWVAWKLRACSHPRYTPRIIISPVFIGGVLNCACGEPLSYGIMGIHER